MRILFVTLGIIIVLFAAGWLGFQVKPRPFSPLTESPADVETIALPGGLPPPVERFYREVYGEAIPVIDSAVISGRARLRIGWFTFFSRFRFIHLAGSGYRHYIEGTCFGLPVLKVNEYFLGDQARMEMPFGVTEHEPSVDRAANIAMWAETVWFPAAFLTDPRVRWEAVDDETAVLVVPFHEAEERFIVRFHPSTGLIRFMETLRPKSPTDTERTLWLNEVKEWGSVDGQLIPTVAAVIWLDEGTPWAIFTVEEIILNTEVGKSIRSRGP